MNLTPNATAAHPAARFVGMRWRKNFNCWHMVQAVQRDVFGRHLPHIDIGADDSQTAALLAATAGWSRVPAPPWEGDILMMIGQSGTHVGVWVQGRVLHNLGHQDEHGEDHGAVCLSEMAELGAIGFGHVKVWRARA